MSIRKKIYILLTVGERRRLILLLFPMIMTAIINVIGIAAIVPFIAVCSDPGNIFNHKKILYIYQLFHFTSTNRFLVALGVLVLTALVFSNGFAILTTYCSARVLGGIQLNLSTRFMERCIYQPYEYFLNKNSAVICTDLTGTIGRFVSSYLNNLLAFASTSISIMFIIGTLVYVKPIVFLLIFPIFSLSFLVLYILVKKKLNTFRKHNIKHAQQCGKFAIEAFQGIKDHKICHSEEYYIDSYIEHSRHVVEESIFNQLMSGIPKNVLEIVTFGLVVLLVIYLILVDNSFSSIMPTLALFTFAGYRMLPAMQMMFLQYSNLKVQAGSIDVLYCYFEKSIEYNIQSIDKVVKNLSFEKLIRLQGVSFRYHNREGEILKQINLDISHNQTIGIIGTTGSGKTTLVDIILGLLNPTSGSLLIDNQVIGDSNRRAWQKKLGYVPQHIFLSDTSIIENIALGVSKDEIDYDAVVDAAKLANIHDFISSELCNEYDTVIGEQGVQLSGGQRQRIGIARALYRDPTVLILDEATSALDENTEREVMHAIRNLQHKKTIIMIAHRLSTMASADIIYLLKNGELIDQGTLYEINDRHHLAGELV